MKGLHDVRHYTDVEHELILRRLLQPYKCGDIDSRLWKPASASALSKSLAAAVNKQPPKYAKSPLSQTNKSSNSAAAETDKTGDVKLDGSTAKKTAASTSGKYVKSKGYASLFTVSSNVSQDLQ